MPGAGKTYSLATAIEAGLELFVIVTDPDGEASLIDAIQTKNLDMNKCHFNYIAASSTSWAGFKDLATKINAFKYEDLTAIKTGVAKQDHKQFIEVLNTCANFKDDRTGEEFGPIDQFGPDKMLVIDSLSGLNKMIMDLMIGAKPAAHQGEWGVAMNTEEKFIAKLCSDLDCFVTVVAHLDREVDQIIGRQILTASFLGKKLAPKMPYLFSDYVLARSEGGQFFWSTADSSMALKTRTLPIGDKLAPSFKQIVDKWKKRMPQGSTLQSG